MHCPDGTTVHDRPGPINLIVAREPLRHQKLESGLTFEPPAPEPAVVARASASFRLKAEATKAKADGNAANAEARSARKRARRINFKSLSSTRGSHPDRTVREVSSIEPKSV
jgi:hypothetical protein